jgi:hypothetical protein
MLGLRESAQGARLLLDREQSYLKSLECACRNKGVAVYLGAGTYRRLHDLDGDFHREGEDDDPPIICDVCGRAVPA